MAARIAVASRLFRFVDEVWDSLLTNTYSFARVPLLSAMSQHIYLNIVCVFALDEGTDL